MRRIALTVCTCDNRYLDVLKVFLYTWKLHNGEDVPIWAALYNGNQGIFDGLRRMYGNLTICDRELPARNWEVDPNLIEIMYQRVHDVRAALSEPWDQVMHIDCDVIIRRNIDHIWDGVEPNTIKIWDRGVKREKQGRARYQAGVHIFGNGTGTRLYYDYWMRKIGDGWEFHDGQRQMYFAVQECGDAIHRVQLPIEYNDLNYGDNSAIWHCRHTHLDRDQKYRDEFNRLLPAAQKAYEGATC